ncbi:MAG: proline--tRNA ligase [Candidatus Nanoarchaeia archaeon]|nr:proline--tRNA ligase [Candidatus Nanoarchaeia archaeon]MDD5358017.1 proline--tRNA ligase [Candidatus Nanoarchaeia archaeon]MDD5588936.1 proline--tRNA ligase [Candidatus Nanoarchaeia archaeon]
MKKEFQEGITVKKNDDFSEWFSQIIQKAELADLRYNIKGFLVFQPWSVLSMEKMYDYLEKRLRQKGHKPYWFPAVIPKSNFEKESAHVKGFTPEVFWVTHGGTKKLEEPLALRPTSETAFYQMFNLWIRSYKDLPFKTYQRANVFRYETKATRPFLRSREFYWIETHCVHETESDAMNQVKEDMQTTKEVLHDIYGLPFIFFERPSWDKFAGAYKTFAADVLNPDGKVIQQPSTHIIAPSFAKAFNITYKDKDGKEKPVFTTCYGPAVSRIFASVIIVHGDDKGLKFPWEIAPINVMIVPISDDKRIKDKAESLKKEIEKFTDVEIDYSEKRPGEKFNHWEMKGIPIRIDLGMKDLENKKITLFRRDLDKKEIVNEKDAVKRIKEISEEFTKNLIKKADKIFQDRIKDAKSVKEIKEVIKNNGIARVEFCSVDKDGEKCAEVIEKEISAEVRGTRLDETQKPKGKCAVCGRKANYIVYIARSY